MIIEGTSTDVPEPPEGYLNAFAEGTRHAARVAWQSGYAAGRASQLKVGYIEVQLKVGNAEVAFFEGRNYSVSSCGVGWEVIAPDGLPVGGVEDTRAEAEYEAYFRSRTDDAWNDDDKWEKLKSDFPEKLR